MLMGFPTRPISASSTPGGGGTSSLSLIELRIADTNYSIGQAARIKTGTGGHVEVATGNAASSSKGTIGVFNASGLAGTTAPIVTKGPTVALPRAGVAQPAPHGGCSGAPGRAGGTDR